VAAACPLAALARFPLTTKAPEVCCGYQES
jgi:hypothetical protein